jgi:hypothetical protein
MVFRPIVTEMRAGQTQQPQRMPKLLMQSNSLQPIYMLTHPQSDALPTSNQTILLLQLLLQPTASPAAVSLLR